MAEVAAGMADVAAGMAAMVETAGPGAGAEQRAKAAAGTS